MKTIEISLENEENFEKVNALLKQLKLEMNLKITEKDLAVDPVTTLSEKSLAEEWESDEDKRWDKLL